MRILSIALALLIGMAIASGPVLAQTKAESLKKCEAMKAGTDAEKKAKTECTAKANAMK